MEAVWLPLGGGSRPWSGRSVWVFLARGRFAAKTPAREGWISLDFGGERGAYGTQKIVPDPIISDKS
jgi:hypothetical protein